MEEKEMLTEEITLRLVKEIKRFLLEDALALSRSSDEQLMVRIKEIIDHGKYVHCTEYTAQCPDQSYCTGTVWNSILHWQKNYRYQDIGDKDE